MIEGLKVTIKGAELRDICITRAHHHRQRAEIYADQKASMEANDIDGMQYTNGDPKRVLQDRMELHEGEASEMQFIAEHLKAEEDYLLGRDDLHKLGICKARY